MKFRILVYGFFMLLLACSTKEEDPISFDDLKQTESNQDFQTDTTHHVVAGVQLDAKFVLKKSIDTLFGVGAWKQWDTALYVQRFGPTISLTYRFISGKDSLQIFQMDFTDSLKTMNAFYNWLDCFGVNCTSIRIGGNIRQKWRSQIILVNTQQILSIEGAGKYDIEKLINSLQKDKKKQNWNYVLFLPSHKNAEWYFVKEGEIKKLKS